MRQADGSARVIPEGGEPPGVFIPGDQLGQLRTGDTVTARLEVGRKGRVRGRIIGVGRRSEKALVGVLERGERSFHVVPEPSGPPVMVARDALGGARPGDAVVVQIGERGHGRRLDHGTVREVLGEAEEPSTQVEMLIRQQDWPRHFEPAVLQAAEHFAPPRPKNALHKGRRDLRRITHVTIDGADARDFDDAVAARSEGDAFRVWVSIADVSHYVRPQTPLDQAAEARATSVYFPHAVIPMLPERLSNDLCSLRPEVPRLVLTAEMRVDTRGQVEDVAVYPALIQSAARLTYEQAQGYLDQPEPEHPVAGLLPVLHQVSLALREDRRRRGAIELDLPEPYVVMGHDSVAKHIRARNRLETHRVIEDLMIAANEAVARYLLLHKAGGIFRVHERPDTERLATFGHWVERLGIDFDPERADQPKYVSKLSKKLQDMPQREVAEMLLLRSLAQARYSEKNRGHYGLGSRAYLHFTSPIRRYPDLLVHRALKRLWAQKRSLGRLAELASHCSVMERRAMQMERAVQHLMACHVAQNHVGEVFAARIVGVHPAGLFVRPETLYIEGLLPVASLGAEHYDHIPEDMAFVGRRSGHTLAVGDEIEVRLAAVDPRLRRIDFAPVREERARGRMGRRKKIPSSDGGHRNRQKKVGESSPRPARSRRSKRGRHSPR